MLKRVYLVACAVLLLAQPIVACSDHCGFHISSISRSPFHQLIQNLHQLHVELSELTDRITVEQQPQQQLDQQDNEPQQQQLSRDYEQDESQSNNIDSNYAVDISDMVGVTFTRRGAAKHAIHKDNFKNAVREHHAAKLSGDPKAIKYAKRNMIRHGSKLSSYQRKKIRDKTKHKLYRDGGAGGGQGMDDDGSSQYD